jgi:hypothetical protein
VHRKLRVILICLPLCVALVSSAAAQSAGPEAAQAAVAAAFTYQGQLKRDGALFTGTCDLQFKLWDSATAGAQLGSTLNATGVGVDNGVFAVELNFGYQFTGQARWVEPAVQCADDTSFTTLPRVALTAAPYAIGLMPGATVNGDIPYGAGDATFKATNASASDGTALFGHATAGSGATAGVFGLANSPAGAGVWGKNNNFVGVLGESSTSNGVAGLSATGPGAYGHSSSGAGVHGHSSTGSGVVGESESWVGVYGNSPNQTAVFGESANATGVHGDSTNGWGVWGDSQANIGVHGSSSTSTGVFGESVGGHGVHGQSDSGFAMRADGDASQSLGDGGWIKAMIHVDHSLAPGSQITKCFNSQASLLAVYIPPCGFSVTGVQNGYWDVNFGFDISQRFIQASVWSLSAGYCFVSDCETRVIELRPVTTGPTWVGVTISYNQSGDQTNAPFTLIVY